MNIIWFKKDLRVADHLPFLEASQSAPVLPLYIFENELWQQGDFSINQFNFLIESIKDLDRNLIKLGLKLIIRIGSVINIFNELYRRYGGFTIFSHEETGNLWTYNRDKELRKWLKAKKMLWKEYPNNGVVRGLKNRDGWASLWYKRMSLPIYDTPKKASLIPIISSDAIPSPKAFGLPLNSSPFQLKGGREEGKKLLETFLSIRGKHYTKEMSSPITAQLACSRLSPHFAFGTLSIKEAFQKAQHALEAIKQSKVEGRTLWGSAYRSFLGRLRWHCHFIQKLEDQPSIETHNMHSAYDGLRKSALGSPQFEAWKKGLTGFPLIDACMRFLIANGWLNFRMRALLVSFSSYHLFLDWKEPARYLASLFVDYEPGIHYSQIQMQSGTTGMNTLRIYSPTKQAIDQDKEGSFIKKWVPELRDMPQEMIHTPWEAPLFLNRYPKPVVDEQRARKQAADILYKIRKGSEHKKESQALVKKHGSRKKNRFTSKRS